MGKLGRAMYSHTGTSQQGKVTTLTTGKMTSGGGKLGGGSGKLKKMMTWKDTGKKGPY